MVMGKLAEKKQQRALHSLALFVPLIAIYVALCFVAYILYPAAFSPLNALVEELGNPITNPSGVIYYNLGVLIVNVPVFFLVGLQFASAKKLTASYDKVGKVTFYLTGIFLALFCMFSILSLLVPLGVDNELNSLTGTLLVITYELFVTSFVVGIRRETGHVRWEPTLGVAVFALNLVLFALMTAGFPIAEWVMYVLCWGYIVAFLYAIA